jgi:3-isopropylmalate dehydratase small subunit
MATAHKFGDNVNTDEIIPARYLNTTDPAELARHCMEDADPGFAAKIAPGDVIVGGANFGCGSSREHAPLAIKAVGVSCVIAGSFARIFYRNCINMGLPIVVSPQAAEAIADGDQVEVDLSSGVIRDKTRRRCFHCAPFPPELRAIIDAGGLMAFVKRKQA